MQNTPVYNRYSITLNIGLDNNPIGLLPEGAAIGQLASLVAHHLQSSGGIAIVPNTVMTYTLHPATDKTERTYAVSIDVNSRAYVKTPDDFSEELAKRIYALSAILTQDAIAYSWIDVGEQGSAHGQGMAGPRADLWGEFNPDLFLPVLPGSDAVRFPVLVG